MEAHAGNGRDGRNAPGRAQKSTTGESACGRARAKTAGVSPLRWFGPVFLLLFSVFLSVEDCIGQDAPPAPPEQAAPSSAPSLPQTNQSASDRQQPPPAPVATFEITGTVKAGKTP